MNNARSDTMLVKNSYKYPLENGQRCVMIADGFYEWNTTKTEKQPYYIYMRDPVKIENKVDEKVEEKDRDSAVGKSTVELLKYKTRNGI